MAFPKDNTGSHLFVRIGVVGWVTCAELLGVSGSCHTPAIFASWPCFSQSQPDSRYFFPVDWFPSLQLLTQLPMWLAGLDLR